MAPDGGPKDETPPNIIGVYPEPNATNVTTDVIRFYFSKHVDQRSFEQALFISPIIDDIEIRWRGRQVELRIHEPLRENTTYSITIGTDVRDLREGNRLSESFTLAFSTGDEIDRGQISGQVFYEKPEGVLILAYELRDSVMADTLNPAEHEPDYITQTGEHGHFRLPYLRFGKYRIIAIRDEFQNRLYDRDVDPFGVYVDDIEISEDEPIYQGVTIRMHKPDFSRPFVSRVTAVHNGKIVVRFSKAIDPQSLAFSSFRLIHNETQDTLGLISFSVRKAHPSEVYLYTEPQREGEYTLIVDPSVRDLYGNTLLTDERKDIVTASLEDPQEKVVVEYVDPQDGQRNVRPDMPVTLQFSAPVRSDLTEQAIWLVDTNDVVVSGEFLWEDDATVMFKPSQLFQSEMPYTIVVQLDALPAKNDLRYQDSLFTSTFVTINHGTLGTVEGQLLTQKSIGYTIQLERLTRTDHPEIYTHTRHGGGMFSIPHIPEGQYRLWAFEDHELKGNYNYGQVFPFEGSAPFVVFPDTVRVRARWTVDGIILDMRRSDDFEPPEAARMPH